MFVGVLLLLRCASPPRRDFGSRLCRLRIDKMTSSPEVASQLLIVLRR